MQKCFILAVCIMQQVLLIAQTEKTIRDAQRAMFEATQIIDPNTGKIPTERLLQAYSTTLSLQQMHRARSLNWIEMGPKNQVGGRIRTLLIMSDKRKAFVGGITGGLWVTDDINTGVWRPVNDFFSNLNISAIACHPTDNSILYFGTGEDYRILSNYNALTAFPDYNQGAGIWKSTDGGKTWTLLPIPASIPIANFNTVRKIVVNALGEVFATTRSGVYKLGIGTGAQWEPSLITSLQGNDLEIGADKTIYASVGLGGEQGKIYRLQLGQTNWELISGALPLSSAVPFSRVELACSPKSDNVVYALVQNIKTVTQKKSITLYRSGNKGTTWELADLTNLPIEDDPATIFTNEDDFTQADYALAIEIDPTNENNVYIGSNNIYRRLNSATPTPTWQRISFGYSSSLPDPNFVHADQQQILFEPGSSAKAYIATDGGLFRCTNINAATPAFVDINNNLRITQFYTIAISANNTPFYALAGTQDNGTFAFNNEYLSDANEARGGDGAYCFIDPNNHLNRVLSRDHSSYYRSIGGSSFELFSAGVSNRGSFVNPTDWAVLPDNSVNMFSDGNLYSTSSYQLFRWDNIFGTPTLRTFNHTLLANRMVSFIKVSPNDCNTVYLGLSEQNNTGTSFRLVRMTNANIPSPGLPTFTDVTGDLGITAYLSSIAIKKEPSGTLDKEMVLTFSNYGVQSIWYTQNANASSNRPNWVSLDGCPTCLPDMPVRYALFAPTATTTTPNPSNYKLLIATETGVWATTAINGTSTIWKPINQVARKKI